MNLRILLFFTCFNISFSAIAQESEDLLARKITLNYRNTSIEDILRSIETQDFAFTYSAEVFDVKKRVNINVKDETLKAVLTQLFVGQNMECQQMGNKLLIRKKRLTQKEKAPDSLKIEAKTSESKPAEAQNKVDVVIAQSNQAKQDKMAISDELPLVESVQGTADSLQVNHSTNDILAHYATDRSRTAAFIAKYETFERRPLLFVPIYGLDPIQLSPIKENFTLKIEEKEKNEDKKPKIKEPIRDKKFRMYLGADVGYAAIQERDAILIGGSLVFNTSKNFGIGLAGKGFISRRELDTELNNTYGYTGGYGGLLLEATLFPNEAFHISIPVLFAGGEIVYGLQDINAGTITEIEDQRVIFVLEPAINFEINIIKYIRVGFGVAYRNTSGADLKYQSSGNVIMEGRDFEGLSFNTFLKFGFF